MESVIEIKGIGKKYRITHKRVRYATLRDIIGFAIFSPFQHAKNQAKKILGRDIKEEFWALKDINLEVRKGEVIGIIGRNGAGKSTLLKILTSITPPTEGEIRIRGKVASLLEVGTGFHPELTGRENIFLNGAILGMTKKEIEAKFDQIVGFSGIEKFLDTPVKRYSSGMYVRLAFSVAAHLEPDILLVDEVLAVGDAEFQKKCLGKMDEVTKTAGRTILFVSHNMDAIRRLCKTTILLDQGKIAAIGNTDEVIEKYLKGGYQDIAPVPLPITDGALTLHDFSVTQKGTPRNIIDGEVPFQVNIEYSTTEDLHSFRSGIYLRNQTGVMLVRSYAQDWDPNMEELAPGRYRTTLTIPARLLLGGEYRIEAKLFCLGIRSFFENRAIERQCIVHKPKSFNEVHSKTGHTGYFTFPDAWKVDATRAASR